MARLQTPQVINLAGVSTTPVQISSTEVLTTSFIVQNPLTSTDFLKLGNNVGQFFQIAPGRDFEVNGDNLDVGASAYLNLQNWYVVAVSGTQSVNIIYLERF